MKHRRLAIRFLAAAAADAVGLLGALSLETVPLWTAAGLRVALAAMSWRWSGAPPSGRALAAALTLAVPAAGAVAVAVVLGTRGGNELDRLAPPLESRPRRRFSAEDARRLADGLPICERLVKADADERRALLGALVRRADAGSLALLRWALAGPVPDLAIEAALALEDLHAGFEAQLGRTREKLAREPSFESAAAAARIIAGALTSGVADGALVPALLAEARRYQELAAALDPARASEVATALIRGSETPPGARGASAG